MTKSSLPMFLLRLILGVVFITEGLLKFMQPVELGMGRFAHIGLPVPESLATLVGAIEISAGTAMLLNFFTGDAAILLLGVIVTALVTTKIPILLGYPLGRFQPLPLAHYGLMSFLHESRTDLMVLFGLIAVLIDSGVSHGRRRWNS